MCERCRDPNRVDLHEYTITKTAANGEDVKGKRVLCGSCAQHTKGAGFKLTGGKAAEASEPSPPGPEAEQEQTPEEPEEPAEEERKPAPKRSR
jgi:hypothetical protein